MREQSYRLTFILMPKHDKSHHEWKLQNKECSCASSTTEAPPNIKKEKKNTKQIKS